MTTLDCRAHRCPHPVVETRKLMLSEPGTALTILVGDETARENVTRLARSQGYEVRSAEAEGGFALEMTPGSAPEPAAPVAAEGPTVVFVAADVMGSGDDELGAVLLKNFLCTLTELDDPPATLLFVNAGVKLTCRGSEVLEALDALACRGVDIASCGLCLEFYHLKEQLAVGRSTNMLEIIQTLHQAGRVIRP